MNHHASAGEKKSALAREFNVSREPPYGEDGKWSIVRVDTIKLLSATMPKTTQSGGTSER